MAKKVLLVGANGYVGSRFVERFKDKYDLKCIDSLLRPGSLPSYIEHKDYRDMTKSELEEFDMCLWLAGYSSVPLSKANPVDCYENNYSGLVDFTNKFKGILIYASSGSVYGIKKERNVTEDLELKPISIYNKTKMIAERILLSYKKEIDIVCIRPATVCGFSKRLRLDVSVNMLTYQAYKKNKITVLGGKQIRPNIHIKDLVRLFHFSLKKKIPGHIINAGFENLSILNLAKKIQKKIKCKIIVKKSNDPRSYRLSSNKLEKLGFKRKYNIDYAILELKNFFESKNFKDKIDNYNIKKLKKLSFE